MQEISEGIAGNLKTLHAKVRFLLEKFNREFSHLHPIHPRPYL